jgi:hypothetical protein
MSDNRGECPFVADGHGGITIREWLSGQALVGLLAFSPGGERQYDPAVAAMAAVGFADALLRELAKPEKEST